MYICREGVSYLAYGSEVVITDGREGTHVDTRADVVFFQLG